MLSQPGKFCVFGTKNIIPIDSYGRRRFSLAAAVICALRLTVALFFWTLATTPTLVSAQSPQPVPSTLGTLPQALSGATLSETSMIGLRRHVVVRSDVVRLGDLFDGPVPSPDKALFRAPAPGESLQLDVAYLARLAQENGLNWKPLSQSDSATITRASNRITTEELLSPLIQALTALGMEPTADIDFSPALPPLAIPAEAIPHISIANTQYDRTSGRFTADATITTDVSPPMQIPVSGISYRTLDIPVAASTTMRGQILKPEDIIFQRVRANAVGTGVATDYDQVIGLETRRVLRPGEPFRLRDLNRPLLVKKGSLITMILATPLMQLSVQGKALEDGALGDVIKVQNPRSGKTILGTVVENRTVTVESSDTPGMQ